MSSHSSFVVANLCLYKGFGVETLLQNVADTVMSQVAKIQTTLYDLVATLNAELSPDEDDVVTAMSHIGGAPEQLSGRNRPLAGASRNWARSRARTIGFTGYFSIFRSLKPATG